MSRTAKLWVMIIVGVTAVAALTSWWFLQQRSTSDSIQVSSEKPDLARTNDDPSLSLGLSVYAEKCAPCHGATGRGDGPAAYVLYPKARDFCSGQFRLTSTQSGLPSDADLLRTLKRGIPGSSMPPWAHLPDSVLSALVSTIRELAVEGRTAMLMESNAMTREQAVTVAKEVLAAGFPAEVPVRPTSGIDLSSGRQLYVTGCAPCHDLDGRGLLKRDLKDDDGYPIFARDFTQGVFKGGSEPEVLALRIARGLPGSPMPGLPYTAEELWSIVDYLGTLIKPGAQERAEQTMKELRPIASSNAVPRNPSDPQWQEAGSVFLPVTPLWWRNDRIEGVEVSLLRYSEEVGFRLEWSDSTADISQLSQQGFSDGVAIQFSNADDPPSFTMGSAGRECDIWYWRASLDPLVAGVSAQRRDPHPNYSDNQQLSEEIAKDAAFMTATAAGNPVATTDHSRSIQNLQATGFGTLGPDGPENQTIEGSASRTPSGWSVVFIRRMQPTKPGDVVFDPNRPMHIGFAVWDGHNQDRNGQKSTTIWHKLSW